MDREKLSKRIVFEGMTDCKEENTYKVNILRLIIQVDTNKT